MTIEIKKQMTSELNPKEVSRFIIIARVNGRRIKVFAPISDSIETEGEPTNRDIAQAACMQQLKVIEAQ